MTRTPPESTSLAELNRELHERMEEGLLQVLEALTELRVDEARERWMDVIRRMDAHADAEARLVIPLYDALGEAPRGGSAELMEADHLTLNKVQVAAKEALASLGQGPVALRRQMVLALPLVYRVRSVLEHHTAREQAHMYPALDEGLAPADSASLRVALTEAWGGP